MNTFELDFRIGEKYYYLYVDSSKDEWKRIVINNQELVSEKYTLALNRHAYIIYYPIIISDNVLVVSIDDSPLVHKYNVYLNNVSLIDNSHLDDKYNEAVKQTSVGIKKFIKNNWSSILKNNIIALISSLLAYSLWHYLNAKEFTFMFFLIFLIVPIFLPLFVAVEWLHYKNVIKKYKSCFRKKRYLK